ncbi:MAG: isoleucine--tRNA ligase [Candidatus Omnitrophica bacterium]|nr:isoleucine--tRNA ligase [Candidatus Omnitrophota bacterium]
MDYKNTINLPKTEFSMKANLSQKEPLILAKWQEDDIYQKIMQNTKALPKYILHDGPPYANGNIHIGHALNKILKDIILKYKTLRGFNTPFVPGWDCHGLPVEHQLFKELGKRKEEVEQVTFREKAREFALKFVDIQKEQFKRLGIFGDWDNPYLTLSCKYEAEIIRSFGALAAKGYIYKGTKPVNWCCNCETALAEAEVEYDNHNSPSIFVKFALNNPNNISFLGKHNINKASIVIWTTTPWTLMGNVACAVHPDFTYVFVKIENEALVLEKNLIVCVFEKMGIDKYEIIGEVRGKELEKVEYSHPLGLRKGIVALADYVSCEDGTGVVHIAPGYGADDFLVGKRYKLDILMQVNDRGIFFENIPEVGNLHVVKAGRMIIEKLRERGALLWSGSIAHSYPHCWRCKKPIIFRATEQWFMSIGHNNLRDNVLKVIKDVKWVPDFGQNRITSMVESRPDWCLSRQRLWGVPIPVFYCKGCNETVAAPEVIEGIAKIVEQEGANIWFKKTAVELMPKGYKCGKCNSMQFTKEKDILDVWFDSGVSHQAVLRSNKALQYPADLYLEGSDQHRGWFQAALISAMAIEGSAPFKEVLTHGFTVDGEGKKMSKSRGNVIAPQQVIDRLGVDVLRLCIASSDYNDDVRMSQEIIARVSESYRKIRNTLKFTLGNLADFDPEKDSVEYLDLLEIDRWALSALHNLLLQVTQAYDRFIFHQAIKLVYNFCIVQMSSFYLDVLKDRLYTCAQKSQARRSAQTVLYEILKVITALIAPVLPFTAEEVNSFSPGYRKESIFLSSWPQAREDYIKSELNDTWKFILEVRNCVLKSLEAARADKLIGNSLQAKVKIGCAKENKNIYRILRNYLEELPGIFIVSVVELHLDIDTENFTVYNITLQKPNAQIENGQINVRVEKAQGEKCIRCWNYSQSIGNNEQHPKLCERCVKNLQC